MVSQQVMTSAPEPLAGSLSKLYAVYLEIAKKDHHQRLAALYGKQLPPLGQTRFRPLPFNDFVTRYESCLALPNGEETFRRQLARWATVYGVKKAESEIPHSVAA
jgi:hypothetical protein